MDAFMLRFSFYNILDFEQKFQAIVVYNFVLLVVDRWGVLKHNVKNRIHTYLP